MIGTCFVNANETPTSLYPVLRSSLRLEDGSSRLFDGSLDRSKNVDHRTGSHRSSKTTEPGSTRFAEAIVGGKKKKWLHSVAFTTSKYFFYKVLQLITWQPITHYASLLSEDTTKNESILAQGKRLQKIIGECKCRSTQFRCIALCIHIHEISISRSDDNSQ